jgi:tripartite-type tricarboxylate transporter receptor subunit TctC
VVAPAGTPGEIVTRVNREIGEFLKSADIQQR